MISQILAYIMVALLAVVLFLFILSGPIVDWMYAREKRKKAAKAAAESAAKSAPGAAPPNSAAAV